MTERAVSSFRAAAAAAWQSLTDQPGLQTHDELHIVTFVKTTKKLFAGMGVMAVSSSPSSSARLVTHTTSRMPQLPPLRAFNDASKFLLLSGTRRPFNAKGPYRKRCPPTLRPADAPLSKPLVHSCRAPKSTRDRTTPLCAERMVD